MAFSIRSSVKLALLWCILTKTYFIFFLCTLFVFDWNIRTANTNTHAQCYKYSNGKIYLNRWTKWINVYTYTMLLEYFRSFYVSIQMETIRSYSFHIQFVLFGRMNEWIESKKNAHIRQAFLSECEWDQRWIEQMD